MNKDTATKLVIKSLATCTLPYYQQWAQGWLAGNGECNPITSQVGYLLLWEKDAASKEAYAAFTAAEDVAELEMHEAHLIALRSETAWWAPRTAIEVRERMTEIKNR